MTGSDRARHGSLQVLVFPKDANPYQARLYEALGEVGVDAHYVGDCGPSHTLNLLALPLQLVQWRIRGVRILHVHWVFGFAFTGASTRPRLRSVSYRWYLAVLGVARALGIHVVWTLHNVLPHEQVFPDDVRARRALIDAASLVVAHSPQALDELRERVGEPRRAVVLAHPRYHDRTGPGPRRAHPRRVLMFGRIAAYKGVQETIDAFEQVAAQTTCELTIAGQCDDPHLRATIETFATRHPRRVDVRLQHIPEHDLTALFGAHDVQWLPYRRATTSGAAIMGAEMGLPLAISAVPAFGAVPGLRLGADHDALADALREIDTISTDRLDDLSARSVQWAASQGTWEEMAHQMRDQFSTLLEATSDGRIP